MLLQKQLLMDYKILVERISPSSDPCYWCFPGIMEETGLRTLAYESSLAYTRGKTVEELRAGYSNTSATPQGRVVN